MTKLNLGRELGIIIIISLRAKAQKFELVSKGVDICTRKIRHTFFFKNYDLNELISLKNIESVLRVECLLVSNTSSLIELYSNLDKVMD